MSTLITSVVQLEEYLNSRHLSLEMCGLGYLQTPTTSYPLRLSQYYADLIQWTTPNDPLKLIAIPSLHEDIVMPYELTDPIGDHARETVPGLIHRYPDRALLLLTTHCRIHCRFCFRREVVGRGRPFNPAGIRSYVEAHPEIHELIFSGGDPFTFPPAFLRRMLDEFAVNNHVKRIRFHTRVPAVDPDAITKEYLELLESIAQQVVVVIHLDHPREVTPQFQQVVKQLNQKNVMVLSQSVLLKNINDSTATLNGLFTNLTNAGVKPYYLHHPDLVVNTSHFRVSIARGKKLFSSLRGRLSSVCLPEYVLDLPGGNGKVPVMWLKEKLDQPGVYEATNFENRQILYTDPGES